MDNDARASGGDVRSDTELLLATRAGDAPAFGVFYRRHRLLALAYLRRRTADPETAADLLAESFAAVLARVLDGAQTLPDAPVAWLLMIARNKLIDSWRRGQVEAAARERLGMESLSLSDADLGEIERLVAETDLMDSLSQLLPSDQLQALAERVLDDRSYTEIARRMDCSEAVVRKRVSRALATLRGRMEGLA